MKIDPTHAPQAPHEHAETKDETGLLGINVGGMPGVDSNSAFAIVCLILAAMAAVSIWIFHRMRFF